jgi:hypothetical protein
VTAPATPPFGAFVPFVPFVTVATAAPPPIVFVDIGAARSGQQNDNPQDRDRPSRAR